MSGNSGGAPVVAFPYPSLRSVALFAVGCVLAGIGRILLYYNAVLVAFLVFDYIMSRKHSFSVERTVDSIISIGVENPVGITVENTFGQSLQLKIKDEYPHGFVASKKELQVTVDPYQKEHIQYRVTPFKRGEYTFKRIYTRRKSLLGLWLFDTHVDTPDKTKVYPNVTMVKKYELLSKKQMLTILGIKPAKLYGRGTEFEMLRDYQIDDEYRSIDWKATSKRGKPITRVYQVERTRTLLLMIDTGRIMGVHVGDLTKLEHAVNSALLVSFVALQLGERVGLCIFSSHIKEYIPPKKNRSHFNTILEALYMLKADSYESNYRKAFEYISWKNRKRCLVVVYTDLIEKHISRGLIQYCTVLQKVHLPLCVAVKDINISKIAQMSPDTERGRYQKAVALKMLKERDIAITELTRRGVRVVNELPERLTVSTLNKYLELKHTMRM
jgi:uncharacterized protein (DUF58 family)